MGGCADGGRDVDGASNDDGTGGQAPMQATPAVEGAPPSALPPSSSDEQEAPRSAAVEGAVHGAVQGAVELEAGAVKGRVAREGT